MLDRPDEPSIGPQSDLIPPRFLDRPLTVEIVTGDNAASSIRSNTKQSPFAIGSLFSPGRSKIVSTVVHVLDFISGTAYTAVTPATGGFMRPTGQIDMKC
jgi:hypothetical protein